MTSQWNQLADVFAADANQGNTEDYAIDNVLIAWPALCRGIAQSFEQTARLKVLDFGCGGGLLCNQLAAKGCEVTGYDASSAMMAAARQNAHTGVTIVETRKAALQPKTYDVVTSCMVLPFIEDLSAIAADFAASLKPDGLIIYATFNPAFIANVLMH